MRLIRTRYLIPIFLLFFLAFVTISTTSLLIEKPTQTKTLAATISNYQIVVVGGSEAGIAAALEGARAGFSVALLEETDWLGGMMAAGVTSMDGNGDWAETGIYKEFLDLVRIEYKSIGKEMGKTCYWSTTSSCFEPKVAKTVFEKMINAEKQKGKILDVFFQDYPTAVLTANGKITSIQTQKGKIYTPQVVIDATEYGDVLALTGASYRAGNTVTPSINPDSCVQDITYPAILKKYPDGVPQDINLANKTLPSSLIQKYNQYKTQFALIVTKDGHTDYKTQGTPVNWAAHNAYRGMPDSSNTTDNYTVENPERITKTAANWANDYPYKVSDLTRGLNRRNANCEAKLKTLLFIYYVQNELGENLWSIANDEGYDTSYNIDINSCPQIPSDLPELKAIEKYFPQIPYIRESRRVVGNYTLTGKDVKRIGDPPNGTALIAAKFFKDSVALGTYPVDLHNCNANSDLESYLGETVGDVPGAPYPFASGPFQIPYSSLVSKDLNNLLTAGKTISVTRLANGASRNQPISMLTGQAAGVAASLALSKNISPSSISIKDLQHALLDKNVILAAISDILPPDPLFKPVQLVRLNEILYGYANLKFGPDNPVERRQIAIAITNMLKLDYPLPSSPTFTDVPATDPYYKFIENLYASKITAGCGTNPMIYCPAGTVTKAQFMTFFMRLWNKADPTKIIINPETPTFPGPTDMPKSHWAYPSVESMVKYAGIENVADTLNPLIFEAGKTVTRGYMLHWIVRILGL